MNLIAIIEEIYSAIEYHGVIKTLYFIFKKPIQIKLPLSNNTCNTSIDILPLSVRSFNALKRNSIDTIGDVVTAINEDKLLKIRQLGIKCRSEIRVVTSEYGYNCLSERQKKEFIRNIIKQNSTSLK